MPEITVSVKQAEENSLVDNVIQLVNYDDAIVLVADMRRKNVDLVATGGQYKNSKDGDFFHERTSVSFFFRDQEQENQAKIIIRGKFQDHWVAFGEVSRYSAFMCLVRSDSWLGLSPPCEVWRRDGKD